MVFLVHYDRRAQRLMAFEQYADEQASRAYDDQLALELSLLGSDRENEIVIYQAEDEAAFRAAYPRYFHSMAELMQMMLTAVESRSPC